MIRSGSTWQYNVTAELLELCGAATRRGFAGTESKLQRWISEDTDAVIKIHRPYQTAISDARSGRARVLYIHRDLRDVAASLMQYEKRRLEPILQSGRLEDIWRDHLVWSSVPGVLVQRYEHMLIDTFTAVEQIRSFLELEIAPHEVGVIDRKNSLENRQRELEASRSMLDPVLHPVRAIIGRALRQMLGREVAERLARPFGYVGGRGIDPHTHLHRNHIGGGGVNSYREVMTRAEQEEIERVVSRITGSDSELSKAGWDQPPPADGA